MSKIRTAQIREVQVFKGPGVLLLGCNTPDSLKDQEQVAVSLKPLRKEP